MTADMEPNKKLSLIVTELSQYSIFRFSQSCFKIRETIRLNATHYFIMKIPSKRQLQQIASNHSSEINFKDFMKLYKNYTKEPYSYLINNSTLSSDNPLTFGKNLL